MKSIFEPFVSRFFISRIFISLFLLCPCGQANAVQNTIRIAIYGDSLTSGYQLQPEQAFPAKLERKFKEVGFNNVEVSNMSVAGETTAGGVERLNSVLIKHPDIVILELGSNDALRGISPPLIYNNLMDMTRRLIQNGSYVILAGAKAPPDMGYAYSSQLDAIYEQVVSLNGKLPFYPFILNGIVGKPELNLADGLHPSSKGVEVMVENIYPLVDAVVRKKWEDLQYAQQYQYQQQQQLMQNNGMPAPEALAPPVGAPAQ